MAAEPIFILDPGPAYCGNCGEEIAPTPDWPMFSMLVLGTDICDTGVHVHVRPVECGPCAELRELLEGGRQGEGEGEGGRGGRSDRRPFDWEAGGGP